MSHLDDELTLAVADLDEQVVLALVQERLDARLNTRCRTNRVDSLPRLRCAH